MGGYAGQSGTLSTQIQSELAWFTGTVWRAGYDAKELPEGMVSEAKTRLRQFK